MKLIKQIFNFYINGSLHVAASALSLVLMTNHMFGNGFDPAMEGFAFFGTVFGYNFIKYESFFRSKKPLGPELKAIFALSLFSASAAAYFFFCLKSVTQAAAAVFFLLTFLYAVPVSSKSGNMRNQSGIKIYIVAFCWSGVTTVLPLMNSGTELGADVFLKFLQRFLLVIVLVLIFEIIDLKNDAPELKTVPQKISVRKTKLLGISLLLPFYLLEFFKTSIDARQLFVNAALVAATSLFMAFADETRSRYYTSFWAESIPIFWLALVYLV
ncbi:MAG TPA: hypothetical protein VFR70_02160 [Flavobacterium sp.]|nr:hypothetical protein [Flavobacterium sp.]